MRDVALDRAKLRRLTGNILPSRTMADVASEMAEVYRQVLEGRTSSARGEEDAGRG
jgi:hypothetical protein